jgi:hypothetical protein
MRLAILDLPAAFDQAELTAVLSHFAPVLGIDVIRDGDPLHPLVLVQFSATPSRLEEITLKIDSHALLGHPVRAHIMLHE